MTSIYKLVVLLTVLFASSVAAKAPNFDFAAGASGSVVDSFCVASSSAVDDFGNVYVVGGYKPSADFDPGAGVTNHTSAGGHDFFVLALDLDGDFIWANAIGGSGSEFVSDMTLNALFRDFIRGH